MRSKKWWFDKGYILMSLRKNQAVKPPCRHLTTRFYCTVHSNTWGQENCRCNRYTVRRGASQHSDYPGPAQNTSAASDRSSGGFALALLSGLMQHAVLGQFAKVYHFITHLATLGEIGSDLGKARSKSALTLIFNSFLRPQLIRVK